MEQPASQSAATGSQRVCTREGDAAPFPTAQELRSTTLGKNSRLLAGPFPTSCSPSGAGAQTAGAGHVYSLANANQKKILFLQQHPLSRGENVPRSLIGRPSRQIWREGLANHSCSLCHLGGSRPPTPPRFYPPDYQMDERKPRHVSGRFGRLRPGILPSELMLTHCHPTRGARINKNKTRCALMSKDIHFSRERMRGALVGPGQPRHWLARSSPPRFCHNAVIWVQKQHQSRPMLPS